MQHIVFDDGATPVDKAHCFVVIGDDDDMKMHCYDVIQQIYHYPTS